MKRRSSPIRSRISDGGRDQFSELKEKIVRKEMPRSPAARTVRRNASTPRRWPSPRGKPRAAAQRPLPSMMMATWRGTSKEPPPGRPMAARRSLLDRAGVAQTVMISFSLAASSLSTSAIVSSVAFCTSLGLTLVVVLADLVLLLQLLEEVEAVAAHVAHRDPRGLGVFVRDLDELLAPLLVELGNAQLISCPSVDGVSPRLAAKIAFSTAWTIDRSQTCTLSSRGSGTLIGGELVERHVGAVGVDLHMVEQRRRRASGAQPAELLLERLRSRPACGA